MIGFIIFFIQIIAVVAIVAVVVFDAARANQIRYQRIGAGTYGRTRYYPLTLKDSSMITTKKFIFCNNNAKN